MIGRLSIQHLDAGSLAGLKQDYSGPKVTFGTAATAHVCYDAGEDPAVVAEHAVIWLEAEGARVEPVGIAKVFVNDQRVRESGVIAENDVIRLGGGGPQLRVTTIELATEDAPSRTVMGGRRARSADDPKTAAGRRSGPAPLTPPPVTHRPPTAAGGDIMPTVVGKRPTGPASHAPGQPPPVRVNMGGGVTPGLPNHPPSQPPPPAAPAKPRTTGKDDFIPEHVKNRPAGAGIGMNTLMGVVDSVTKRERGRNTMRLAAVVVVMLLLGGLAVGGVYLATRDTDEPVPTTVVTQTPAATDWAVIAEKVMPSVCLSMIREPGTTGTEMAGGTVWSVGEGVFATNAHVAEIFYDTEIFDGVRAEMIIRTPGPDPKDLRVKSVVIHPGYKRWTEVLSQYSPFDPADLKFYTSKLFPACDVALMYIEKEDWKHQPPPLKLADAEAAAKVAAGQQIATFGYPSEGVMLNTILPHSEGRYGVVAKTGDTFLAPVARDKTDFVWYNWESAGGASGSPVFNKDGEVVSLVSAGNTIGWVGEARVDSGGTSVGPHVRLLKELLDETVQDKQADRDVQWHAELEKLFLRGAEHSDNLADKLVTDMVGGISSMVDGFFDPSTQTIQRVSKTTGTLEVRGNQRASMINGIKAEPGFSFFIAIATSAPTAITMYPETQRPTRDIEFPGYFTIVPQKVDQAFTGPVVVEASPDAKEGSVQVTVYVYRITKK